MNVAVVGAGIAGASTAKQLAERGHSVALFEQFPLGHSQGSSHGKSRIVRRAYADTFYTECMTKAYPLWADLERQSGQTLLHEVGLMYFGAQHSESVKTVVEGLVTYGIEHEVFRSATAGAVMPQLRLEDDEIGIFTPGAGWVAADLALAATQRLAAEAGCQIEQRKANKSDLEKFEQAVVCAGPWVRQWWPEAPVTPTLQTYGYVDGAIEGPVWIDDDGYSYVYGFPGTVGEGSKIGIHRRGAVIDPDDSDRTPVEDSLHEIAQVASRRFGFAPDVQVHHPAGCIYTSTVDEDFLVKQIDSRTWVASGCSGHGFKFGPWIGQLMADLVEGKDDLLNYPRFIR